MARTVFLALVACVIAGHLWVSHLRRKKLREYADQRNMTFQGPAMQMDLPKGFPFDSLNDLLNVGGWSSSLRNVRNVVSGWESTDRLLAFDVDVGRNRSTYKRTVVARRSTKFHLLSSVPPGYVYVSTGEWQLAAREEAFFSSTTLLEPAVIERLWELMR